MIAAGFTPAQIAAVEASTWIGPPALAYAAKRWGPKKMDYGTTYSDDRPSHYGYRPPKRYDNSSYTRRPQKKNIYTSNMTKGFIGPVQRKRKAGPQTQLYKRSRYIPLARRGQMYKSANDMDTKFVVLKNNLDFNTDSTSGDLIGAVSVRHLYNMPAFNYWATLFERYCLKWIKVTWHAHGSALVGYSMVTLDSNDHNPATIIPADIYKNSTVRKHDFTQDRYAPGRTFNLVGAEAFKDYLSTATASIKSDLGDSLDSNFMGTKKGAIQYEIKSDGVRKVFISVEMGVSFKGLKS